eukprot:COSAG06_NODE_2491_length_6769_cov_2.679310_4_plen_293_part_00
MRSVGRAARAGADPVNIEGEGALDPLGPHFQRRDLAQMRRGRAHLRVRGGAAVVLLASWVVGVALPCILRPVDRELVERDLHDLPVGSAEGEVGLEGRTAVAGRGRPGGALGSESHLESSVLRRAGAHAEVERATEELGDVRERGQQPAVAPAVVRLDLREPRRVQKRHHRALARECADVAGRLEARVGPPAHHRVVHVLPVVRSSQRAIERRELGRRLRGLELPVRRRGGHGAGGHEGGEERAGAEHRGGGGGWWLVAGWWSCVALASGGEGRHALTMFSVSWLLGEQSIS